MKSRRDFGADPRATNTAPAISFPRAIEGESKVEAGQRGGGCVVAAMTGPVCVRRHPRGGFTHAIPDSGTAKIYRGNWPTKRAAVAAL